MSWGIVLKEVYFNRVTKDRIHGKLHEAEQSIKYNRDELLNAFRPDVRADEAEYSNAYLFSDIWDALEEAMYERFVAQLVIENLDQAEQE